MGRILFAVLVNTLLPHATLHEASHYNKGMIPYFAIDPDLS